MDEILAALERWRTTSAGLNLIRNEMLSRIAPAFKECLLSMHNRIRTESSVSDAWREATVSPVPKPGRDLSLATGYS
jgi:hypothetical protein